MLTHPIIPFLHAGGFEFDLFFWLGESTSVDEQGAAAILSRDLDDKLGGSAVQHRCVQGHESADFVQALGGTLEYMDGGCESGFKKVGAEEMPTRLLHIKGFKQTRCVNVEVSANSQSFYSSCG